ncbi:unnamed protein product [Clonostachys rosea]|uniref:Uncharacterized protein n=1 Tax=Bionectria ochroleuca TaxID=29856 RepID=A0ABY6TSV4_BIOOC|nr:unnamed protein product [Clonostachys rosea]
MANIIGGNIAKYFSSQNNTILAGDATQQNSSIFDICLIKNTNVNILSRATHAAVAQEFGSPLETRHLHSPLLDLIQTLDSGGIQAKRFHGYNVYEAGQVKELSMDKYVNVDGERLSALSSVIVCLSVPLTATTLSTIVASAIILYIHGEIDGQTAGAAGMLQGKIKKYANAIIGRDGMCNKLENAKQRVCELLKAHAPQVHTHKMFLPPMLPAEEQDFVVFIARLWSSKVEGEIIYTRSIKLLALSLLLSEYGWQIDIYVEKQKQESPVSGESTESIAIKAGTGSLIVVYSTLPTNDDRSYVENHASFPLKTEQKYPTSACKAAFMGEVSGLSLARDEDDQVAFMSGYKAIDNFFNEHVELKVLLNPVGMITMTLICDSIEIPRLPSSWFRILPRFNLSHTPHRIKTLVMVALCKAFPDCDWEEVNKQILEISVDASVLFEKPSPREAWVVTGAVFALMNRTIMSLVNISESSNIRSPAGDSVFKFLACGDDFLDELFNQGKHPAEAIIFCAASLTGADCIEAVNSGTSPSSFSDRRSIVGYWANQHGLLLTPVFERCLYSDLPQCKMKLCTFHNTPIIGMPFDEGGWIRSAKLSNKNPRRLDFTLKQQHSCDVLMEYRPHFEKDPRYVTAAVYLDGVFHNTFSVPGIFRPGLAEQSFCSHLDDTSAEHHQKPLKYITLDSFQPGQQLLPRDEEEVHLIVPQNTLVSRLFCSMEYGFWPIVIQHGCLDCAIGDAKKERHVGIIIPRTAK